MAETKTHAENADLPNPPALNREEVVNEVKNALLAKIRERVETLSDAHSKEVNIATRYDYRVRVEELIALFNELANSQL
mgnify:CR=1 FL=1